MGDQLTRKFIRAFAEDTPEQIAVRTAEAKKRREEEAAAWKVKMEQNARLAVPREIEKLRKESAEKSAEADKLAALLKAYPNLRQRNGRWNKVAYYSKDVNELVNCLDVRHNCGCCQDSPLEIWPYVETPHGNVYSDPPDFRVGEKEPSFGGDRPYKDWDKGMRAAGIPEGLITRVAERFRKSAEEAMEAANSLYGDWHPKDHEDEGTDESD